VKNKKIIFCSFLIIMAFGIAKGELEKKQESLGQISAKEQDILNDRLVEKLNHVQMNLAPNDPSKVSVTLRLADLLAEKSRKLMQKELEVGCPTTCNAGLKEREKSLKLYLEVVDKTPEMSQGKVLIQIGHLYELMGQEKEAISIYEKSLLKITASQPLAEIHLSLGEIFFKKSKFQEALKHYDEVLKVTTASSRGLAAHRKAWCFYNLGQIDKAIEQISEMFVNTNLLNRSGVATQQIDSEFAGEVSKDLATFMAQSGIEKSDIEKIFQISPEALKLSNLQLLAIESERIGKKKEALLAWKFLFQNQALAEQRVESSLHVAALELELGNKTESISQLENSFSLWKELKSCTDKNSTDKACEETRNNWKQYMRSYIVTWNQAEKKQASEELYKAYDKYLELFKLDYDMALWGAQTAISIKEWAGAEKFFQLALESSQQNEALKDTLDRGEKLEQALLLRIEMAEQSQKPEMLQRAQESYLAKSLKKTKTYEVEYQLARQIYEKADYQNASEKFRELALRNQAQENLRKQAADLSLDALVFLKQDDKLIKWSQEYAEFFKKIPNSNDKVKEFENISQKAILTYSASNSNNSFESMKILKGFELSKASPEDQLIYLRNKVILSEKLAQLREANVAAEELMNHKLATAKDRQWALEKRSWYAELQLDFNSALKYSEKLQEKPLLKMALYAELAGLNSRDHYLKVLTQSKDIEEQMIIAMELIRKSNQPEKEFEVQKKYIKNNEKMAQILAEIYFKNQSDNVLKKLKADSKMKETLWGKLVVKNEILNQFKVLKLSLKDQNLQSTNQKILTGKIKLRSQSLSKLEELGNQAIALADWSAQLVVLDLVQKESDRFYQELMTLPVPEGLGPEDEQKYLQLLGQQSAPYKTQSEMAQLKVKEFWQAPQWKENFIQSSEVMAELRKESIQSEMAQLSEVAPELEKTFFKNRSVEIQQKGLKASTVAIGEIEKAKSVVREKPFDKAAIENLFQMEKENKNLAMMQYLEGRLKNLQSSEVSK
jgi:hypothetical protein